MIVKDESKCKQCDGPLPFTITNNITRYHPCPYCAKLDNLMKPEIKIPEIKPEPVPVIEPTEAESEAYCREYINAMELMANLLSHKLVNVNKLTALIRIDNAKLSDEALKAKIASAQLNWVHCRVVESEGYQELQRRSKKFLEVNPDQKSYTALISPDKPEKPNAAPRASKQSEIISRWQKHNKLSLAECNRYWLMMFPATMSDSDKKAKEKQLLMWCKLGIAPEKSQQLWLDMGNKV